METASFSGILRTILYIFAFYYIFKFLARIFFPILIKKAVEKAGQNFNQQQQSYQQYTTNNDEVIYDTRKENYPKSTKKVGEYIDFEELK